MLTLTIDNPFMERQLKKAAQVQHKSVTGLLVDTFVMLGLGNAVYSYDATKQPQPQPQPA